MERSSIERYKLWCVLIALCHILGKNVHFCYCCYCSLLMALLPPACDMSWGQWSFKPFPYLTWLCRVRPANLHGQSFFFNFIEHIATLFIHVQYMYNKTKLLFIWPVFFYVFHNFVTTCSFMHHSWCIPVMPKDDLGRDLIKNSQEGLRSFLQMFSPPYTLSCTPFAKPLAHC